MVVTEGPRSGSLTALARLGAVAGNLGTPSRTTHGAIAQLEEHLLCKQGVSGSSPLSSTTTRQNTAAKITGRALVPLTCH
jgi:hypothetical protein